MSRACDAGAGGNAALDGEGAVAALRSVEWVALAAAPIFAIMALATGVLGGYPMDMPCSAGHGAALGGMVPMYLLMSAFHSAPWLKLIGRLRGASRRSTA
jgi:membrane associated rhomboid family serine protease